MNERDIVQYIVQSKRASEDSRANWQNVQDESALWEQYMGKQDFSDKEDWQAQIVYPHTFSKTKKAVALIKRSLLSSPNYLTVVGQESSDDPSADILTKAVRFWFNKEGFINKFTMAVEAALVARKSALKFYWDTRWVKGFEKQRRKEDFLAIDVIDGDKLHFHPRSTTGYDGGMIEERRVALHVLKAAKGPGGKPRYKNLGKVSSTKPDDRELTDEQKRDMVDSGGVAWVKEAKLLEFWGDIVDKGQNLAHENVRCIVADDNVLIYGPEPNPFWDDTPPYALLNPIQVPFRYPGVGFTEIVYKLVVEFNNMLNLSIDAMKFAVMKQYEVNTDLLADPRDLDTGIFPGKIWESQGGMNQQMFREVSTHDLPPGVMNTMLSLDRGIQEGTGVTDLLSGMPTIKGQPTAFEIGQKTQEAQTLFDALAKDIDSQGIGRSGQLAVSRILQYQTKFSQPGLVRLLGENAATLENMLPEQRYEMLSGNYDFTAKGISLMVERRERLQALTTALTILGQNESLTRYLNIRTFVMEVLENLGLLEVKSLVIGQDRAKALEDLEQQQIEKAQLGNVLEALGAGAQIAKGMGGGKDEKKKPKKEKASGKRL